MTDDNPSPTDIPAQSNSQPVAGHTTATTEALEEYAIPLAATDSIGSQAPLDSLSDRLDSARIVALGESTHGTRDYFRLRHRLLRSLITEHGVRAVALEANFAETLAVDAYVRFGIGDVESALDAVHFWTWNVESMRTLLEWLRSYNRVRPPDDRVRVYGIDAQYTRGSVDALATFFDRVEPGLDRRDRRALTTVDRGGVSPGEDDQPPATVERDLATIDRLRGKLRTNRERYVEQTSRRAFELALRHTEVLEQALTYRRHIRRWSSSNHESTTVEQCLAYRDRSMAANVAWIRSREPDRPIALMAHDGHSNREKQVVRSAECAPPSLGSLLSDRYGSEYVAFGFAFGRGAFQAKTAVSGSARRTTDDAESPQPTMELREHTIAGPQPGTIEEILDQMDRDRMLLDIDRASRDHRLRTLLREPMLHFSVGAVFDPHNVEDYLVEYTYADAFDVLCYVSETERARPIGA